MGQMLMPEKELIKFRVTILSRNGKVQVRRCCVHVMKILAEDEGSSASLQYLADFPIFRPKPKDFRSQVTFLDRPNEKKTNSL
jgi:hypothetical protein